MRKPHYWRAAKSDRLPSSMIFIDTETLPINVEGRANIEVHKLRLGVARYVRMESGEVRSSTYFNFTRTDQIQAFINNRLSHSRPLWIIAHNLGFDLTIIDGWEYVCGRKTKVDKFIFEDGVFYGKLHLPEGTMYLLDSFNYFKASLAVLGKSIGIEKGSMPAMTASIEDWWTYCKQDVVVLSEAMIALFKFNHKHKLGKFGPTIASLSFSAFRTKFMSHDILVHDNEKALKLERLSYFGGIVDTPFIGKVKDSPVYELDVTSMYPFQCTKMLPYQFVGYKDNPSVKCIEKLATDFQVCASVVVNTKSHTFPKRIKSKVIYPVGRYTVSLAHPELMLALDNGLVEYVKCCSWYNAAPIFKEYMQFFIGHKITYKDAGNFAFELLCKYYANTLYGKTAQRSERWMPLTMRNIRKIEDALGQKKGSLDYLTKVNNIQDKPQDTLLIPHLGIAVRIRKIYGVEEIYVGSGESRDSVPIIASTITSYARVYLRELQDIAGWHNWFYSDTDSIWTNEEGYKRLVARGMVKENELGKLSLKKVHNHLTIHGRKDYQTDRTTKRKGIRQTAKVLSSDTFEQWHFPSVKTLLLTGSFDSVTIRKVIKTLRRRIDHCTKLKSGWTVPLIINE